MVGENLVREATVYVNQNPMIAGAVGVVAVGFLIYYAVQNRSNNKPVSTIEPHDREPLEKKTPEYYEKKLKQDGQSVERKLRHGTKTVGVVTNITEVNVHKNLVTVEEEKNWGDDEDEEEDEEIEMYAMKIKPEGTFESMTSYIQENILNSYSKRHIRVVRKKWLEETGSSLYMPQQVEFMDLGGLQVEKTFPGINIVTDVVLMKALEKNTNNIEEYVKKINHWSDNYSQKMGEYEKEIEADERRFGNQLNNR